MSASGYAVTQLLRGTLKPSAGSTEILCRPSGKDSSLINPLVPWYSAIFAGIGDSLAEAGPHSASSFTATVGRIPRSTSLDSYAGCLTAAFALHADRHRSVRKCCV